MKTRRSKRSRNRGERNSEPIPFDLVIEILTRLPAKSIARFRCVSKLWGSTLGSPYFTESFFTISSSGPKLLFACPKNGETFFFSSPQSPQPQNPFLIAANFHMKFPINDPYAICRGLVCGINQRTLEGVKVTVCNPSTGQFLTLPQVKTMIIYFGYDPIHKQFKVLCMSKSMLHNGPYYSQDHQVLTLGTGKELSWRMVKCDIPHRPVPLGYSDVYDGMCINGVCYYFAIVKGGDELCYIVCFDIRSEKFNSIRKSQGMRKNFQQNRKGTLVKYTGKLAMLHPSVVDGIYTGIQVCVLEDAEKDEWSSYIYVLPPPWKNIFEEKKLYFVGVVGTGEIVLSADYISDSFYLLYYNPERNTIRKVEIQGMEAFKCHRVYTCLDHVEDVKPMASL